jgi:hypothetical protein
MSIRGHREWFHKDYAEHRRRFLAASHAAGLEVTSRIHRLPGPQGEELALDMARLGAPDASKVLIVSSATHGIEGFCGSAVQLALLQNIRDLPLPADVAIVLLHALNPFGFAWLHRTDDDNVDLNRNFMDFTQPLPRNPRYAEIHDAMVPKDWDGPDRERAEAFLTGYIAQHGPRALQEALSGGQYEYSDGLFYGGRAPCWSNIAWRDAVLRHASRADLLAVIDIHSGLGAPGACELISGARRNTAEIAAAQAWFGDGLVFPGDTSTAPAATGFMGNTLQSLLPAAVAALVVAEFGTVAFEAVFGALRADNWIRRHETPGSRRWVENQSRMREAFVLEQPAWQSAIVERGLSLVRHALRALTVSSRRDFQS